MNKLKPLIKDLKPYLNKDYELTFNQIHQLIEISAPYWNYMNDGIGFYLTEKHHQLYLTDYGGQIAEWGMNGFDTHDIKTTNHYVHTLLNPKHTKIIQNLVIQFNAKLIAHDELWMKITNDDPKAIVQKINQFAKLCVAIDKQLQIELAKYYHH